MALDEAVAERVRSRLAGLSWPGAEPPLPREPEMSEQEQELWRDLVIRRTGLHFPETRLRFLRQRLWERLVPRHFSTYTEYYQFVRFNPEGGKEFTELMESLLNKETSFFRHPPTFEVLTRCVFPTLAESGRFESDNEITMWSAGCSTGQEAYSMAMTFLDTPGCAGMTAKIFGTDLSERALKFARAGRFRSFELRALPDSLRDRHMVRVTMAGEQFFQMSSTIREIVHFSHLNLIELNTCPLSALDVIFCQNVLIYFNDEERIRIASALSQRLKHGGFLFLAAAEAVGLSLPGMQPVRIPDAIVYQRCA